MSAAGVGQTVARSAGSCGSTGQSCSDRVGTQRGRWYAFAALSYFGILLGCTHLGSRCWNLFASLRLRPFIDTCLGLALSCRFVLHFSFRTAGDCLIVTVAYFGILYYTDGEVR